MTTQNCILIGAPMDCGKRRTGCLMGPDAYRTADMAGTLRSLGHAVQDRGNVTPAPVDPIPHDRLHKLAETIAWTKALAKASEAALRDGFPIFMESGSQAVNTKPQESRADVWLKSKKT